MALEYVNICLKLATTLRRSVVLDISCCCTDRYGRIRKPLRPQCLLFLFSSSGGATQEGGRSRRSPLWNAPQQSGTHPRGRSKHAQTSAQCKTVENLLVKAPEGIFPTISGSMYATCVYHIAGESISKPEQSYKKT